MSWRLRAAATFVAVVSVIAACGPTASGRSIDLTVYGAASLRDVLVEVVAACEVAAPTTRITVATDASSTLRAQIEQGAPADVFLAADRSNPEALVEAGLGAGDAVDFATNELTIIVPRNNPAGISGPADLAMPGVKVVAAGDEVPITTYAEQVVARLATLPGYPADFAAAYDSNIVSREQNARAVLAKVELGEADAAIVYATDARASTRVETIGIPPAANVPATYAGVVVGASAHPAEARAFLAWLAGPDGGAVLARFGFGPPP